MRILFERLERWDPVFDPKTELEKKSFVGVQIMQEEAKPITNHVLMGSREFFDHSLDLAGYGIISIGMPKEAVMTKNACICLREGSSLLEVFYDIQKIFMKFNMWDEELTKALLSKRSLEEICILSIPVFENPIFIHDTNSEVLASVNEMPKQFSWHLDPEHGKRFLPMEIMNDFKISAEYQQTMNTHGSRMFSEQQFGYRILYINLWFEDTYLGRICINELGRKITKGDYEILEYFAKIILSALQYGNFFLPDNSKELKKSLIELLESEPANETLLVERLQHLGWNLLDAYFCVCIYMEKRDYSTYAIDYTCHRLENIFPHYCTFLYRDTILIVVNPSRSKISTDSFFSKLAVFLREGLFKAGVSMSGNDFRRFRYYYIQAKEALNMGGQKNPMFWQYRFSDYVLSYFFEKGIGELLPFMLCEPNLTRLMEYDKKNQTEYYKSLKVFLENERNITKTAQELFVHKSTFLYRLKKIEKLLQIDLNSPKVRLHLLMSYELTDLG